MSTPHYYLTIKEFCDLVAAAMRDQGEYYSGPMHPEDIEVVLSAYMRPFAAGMAEGARREMGIQA